MVVSLTSLADVPRGGSPDDHAHLLAFALAAGCWATCFAVSRWARVTGRVGRWFRPAVLRSVALVAVVGTNALVAWQADASTRHDVARMESYYREFQRISPQENAALTAAFARVQLPSDLLPIDRAAGACTADCPIDVLGTWSTRRDAAAVIPDLMQRLKMAGPTQLSTESYGTGWTITTVTAAGELRVHVHAPASRTFISAVTMPRKPPCKPGDSAFYGCSPHS
jgi:hypothetical protein